MLLYEAVDCQVELKKSVLALTKVVPRLWTIVWCRSAHTIGICTADMADGRLAPAPACDWQLAPNQCYYAFLCSVRSWMHVWNKSGQKHHTWIWIWSSDRCDESDLLALEWRISTRMTLCVDDQDVVTWFLFAKTVIKLHLLLQKRRVTSAGGCSYSWVRMLMLFSFRGDAQCLSIFLPSTVVNLLICKSKKSIELMFSLDTLRCTWRAWDILWSWFWLTKFDVGPCCSQKIIERTGNKVCGRVLLLCNVQRPSTVLRLRDVMAPQVRRVVRNWVS